jgi:hypothetical protein
MGNAVGNMGTVVRVGEDRCGGEDRGDGKDRCRGEDRGDGRDRLPGGAGDGDDRRPGGGDGAGDGGFTLGGNFPGGSMPLFFCGCGEELLILLLLLLLLMESAFALFRIPGLIHAVAATFGDCCITMGDDDDGPAAAAAKPPIVQRVPLVFGLLVLYMTASAA